MPSREELKVQRHQLYNSIADACQHGGINMSYAGAGALLDHLQVVLEAESSRSCADGTEDLDVESQRLQPQHQSLLSKQEAQNAASVVQILKTELADKIKSLACKQSEGRVNDISQDQVQQYHVTATVDKQQGQLQQQLGAAQVAWQRQQQQHNNEIKTWRLAAQHATAVAEAANERAAAADERLLECSTLVELQKQQLNDRRQEVMLLRKQLKQAQKHVNTRQELEQQLHVAVLQPLHGWLRACRLNPKLALEDSSSSMPSLDNGVECEHTPQLSREFIHSAAAAIEQLLARHKTEDVAVTQQQEQQYHEHLQELQHVLEQAQVDLQVARKAVAALQAELDTAKQQQCNLKEEMKLQRVSAVEELQQLRETVAERTAAAKKAGQDLQNQEQQVAVLQQQLQQVQADLTAAKGRAAAAEQQVRQLQEKLQQQVHLSQQQQQNSDQLHRERLAQIQADHMKGQQQALDKLTAEKEAALQSASQQAALTLESNVREHRLAMMEAKAAWDKEKAALEKQQVEALLATRLTAQQNLEQERRQWQLERDDVVQRSAAQQTAVELQAQQQQKALQEQLEQLQKEVHYLRGLSAGRGASRQPHEVAMGTENCSTAFFASDPLRTDGGYAVKFSKAVTAAEADQMRALQEAAATQEQVQQLTRQLEQQEQELLHMRRALDELHRACQAAEDARREAEASCAASAAALQEQHSKVRQLQVELDILRQDQEQELLALQQSMREQVALIQSDARAELEAAQTRMQLLRIKQQRFVSRLKLGNFEPGEVEFRS